MENRKIVSHDEWIEARKRFLAQEKELTRLQDRLSEQRQQLPWEHVDKAYAFDGPNGEETLAGLFDGRSQLFVYHFMFHPDWEAGCPSCSMVADGFNASIVHLNERDVAFAVVSRAPSPKLEAYRKRMGWSFKWVSSFRNDFNRDYGVSFTRDEVARGEGDYNYVRQRLFGEEMPGASVFYKDPAGAVFHTYSTYGRGLEPALVPYQYLDLVPRGRDEANMTPHPQAWVRRHDEYDNR